MFFPLKFNSIYGKLEMKTNSKVQVWPLLSLFHGLTLHCIFLQVFVTMNIEKHKFLRFIKDGNAKMYLHEMENGYKWRQAVGGKQMLIQQWRPLDWRFPKLETHLKTRFRCFHNYSKANKFYGWRVPWGGLPRWKQIKNKCCCDLDLAFQFFDYEHFVNFVLKNMLSSHICITLCIFVYSPKKSSRPAQFVTGTAVHVEKLYMSRRKSLIIL